MKCFIMLIVLILTFMSGDSAPKKYKLSLITKFHKSGKEAEKCSDRLLTDFHHKYPQLTEWLGQKQQTRNFLVTSYEDCGTKTDDARIECFDSWKRSVGLVENSFDDELKKMVPDAAQYWSDYIKDGVYECYGAVQTAFK